MEIGLLIGFLINIGMRMLDVKNVFFIINEDRISFLHRVGNVQVVAKQVQE